MSRGALLRSSRLEAPPFSAHTQRLSAAAARCSRCLCLPLPPFGGPLFLSFLFAICSLDLSSMQHLLAVDLQPMPCI